MKLHEVNIDSLERRASDQFAEDFLLVAEDDYDAYAELMWKAKKAEGSYCALSDDLREEWEVLAQQVVDLVKKEISDTAGLFISEMLQGWGSKPFDIIARQVLNVCECGESH